MWFLGIIIIAAAIAAIPVVLERQRKTIGPAERQSAKGEFASLSQGVTYFRWTGSARGPVAVLIHGLATPSVAMSDFAKGLGRMGYRVLIYDLYGRGLSDAPAGRQNGAFFMRQLADLLDHQDLAEEVTLAGYSMGGSIATLFAARNPHRVSRLILFASAGIIAKESDFSRFCRRYPVIGDWVYLVFARKRILDAIPADGPKKNLNAIRFAQRNELSRKGYLPALLSSRRGILADTLEKEHRKIAKMALPVVAIWAEKDEVIPLSALGKLAQWNRNAHQEVVAGAGHAMPYTHATEMVTALRKGLRD